MSKRRKFQPERLSDENVTQSLEYVVKEIHPSSQLNQEYASYACCIRIAGKATEWGDSLAFGLPTTMALSSSMIPVQQGEWEGGMDRLFDLDLADIDMKRRRSAPAGQQVVPGSQPSRSSSDVQNLWEAGAELADSELWGLQGLQRHGRSLPKVWHYCHQILGLSLGFRNVPDNLQRALHLE